MSDHLEPSEISEFEDINSSPLDGDLSNPHPKIDEDLIKFELGGDDRNTPEQEFDEEEITEGNSLLSHLKKNLIIAIPLALIFMVFLAFVFFGRGNKSQELNKEPQQIGASFISNTNQEVESNIPPVNAKESEGEHIFANSSSAQLATEVNDKTTEVAFGVIPAAKTASSVSEEVILGKVIEMLNPIVSSQEKAMLKVDDLSAAVLDLRSDGLNRSFSDKDLEMIKGAVSTGLSNVRKEFDSEIAKLKADLIDLKASVNSKQKVNHLPSRRPLTLIMAKEGEAKVMVEGDANTQTIINGDVLKGYGRVERIGPFGCFYLAGGETYSPLNATCIEGD